MSLPNQVTSRLMIKHHIWSADESETRLHAVPWVVLCTFWLFPPLSLSHSLSFGNFRRPVKGGGDPELHLEKIKTKPPSPLRYGSPPVSAWAHTLLLSCAVFSSLLLLQSAPSIPSSPRSVTLRENGASEQDHVLFRASSAAGFWMDT